MQATSELEMHVNAPGRGGPGQAGPREDQRARHHVHLLPVHLGDRAASSARAFPADHWERTADKGFQLVYGSTANLFTDRNGQYIGYGPEASELIGIPDPETFCQLPWDKRVARVFCTCFRNREEDENGGAHLTSDCRGNLRAASRRVPEEARHAPAHRLRAGDDVAEEGRERQAERRLFASPTAITSTSSKACVRSSMRVIEYASAMGLDMIQGDHEDAPGQLELNFTYDDALRTADRLVDLSPDLRPGGARVRPHRLLHDQAVHGRVGQRLPHQRVAVERRRRTASTRSATDELPGMERGVHLSQGRHQPLHAGQRRITPKKPGPVGLQCIGGVIEHLPALTAIGCSTVNSYRRLWDQGFWAPVYADWGYQNRTCGLRVSAPGRFEYRAVDSMVNPYLLASALLKAFDDGITKQARSGRAGEPQHL